MAAKKIFKDPVQLMLRLERELRRDFKLAATLNGKESSEVIRELIKQYSDKVLNDFDMMEKLNDRK